MAKNRELSLRKPTPSRFDAISFLRKGTSGLVTRGKDKRKFGPSSLKNQGRLILSLGQNIVDRETRYLIVFGENG